jgi:hypothetical protein
LRAKWCVDAQSPDGAVAVFATGSEAIDLVGTL